MIYYAFILSGLTIFLITILLFYKTLTPIELIYNVTDLDWHIGTARAAPDGIIKTIFTINGESPGPEIHAVVGDVLKINIYNDLKDEYVSIHFHGLKQRGNNHMDGVEGVTECGIPPGETFAYTLYLDEPGTFWYHSHHHFQRIEGLLGALVVYEEKPVENDKVLILQDWYHDNVKQIFKKYMSRESGGYEPVPDNGLINGWNKFDLIHGDWYRMVVDHYNNNKKKLRIRVINAAALADFYFSIDEHELLVLQADATNIMPMDTHSLAISPGQRYLIEVEPHRRAFIRAQMSMEPFQYIPKHFNETVLAIMGKDDEEGIPDTSGYGKEGVHLTADELEPLIQEPAPEPDIILKVSIQTMKLEKVDLAPYAFFNRTTFTPAIGIPNLHVALGMIKFADDHVPTVSAPNERYGGSQLVVDIPHSAVVELIVDNPDDSDHPLHFHGHDFWIMRTYQAQKGLGYWNQQYISEYSEIPMKRDVHVVPYLGHTVIRWKADHPGFWAFHCHVLWHHAAGLMMQFAHGMDQFHESIPTKQVKFCKMQKQDMGNMESKLPSVADRFDIN